jgi:hypothetical protein
MRLQIVLTYINEEIITLFPVDTAIKTTVVTFLSKTNTFLSFYIIVFALRMLIILWEKA